ncbi:hypothetical protein CDAR_182351 [Caerostris darwini]|uniref:Uncharacterized protein n=1 Tax=Caerostris darwini TaxID=1538125 RepID=A0AAV4U5H2_9ARAC|nr:hypothetical protein CDAR_182351 [Caerostris darwini]
MRRSRLCVASILPAPKDNAGLRVALSERKMRSSFGVGLGAFSGFLVPRVLRKKQTAVTSACLLRKHVDSEGGILTKTQQRISSLVSFGSSFFSRECRRRNK